MNPDSKSMVEAFVTITVLFLAASLFSAGFKVVAGFVFQVAFFLISAFLFLIGIVTGLMAAGFALSNNAVGAIAFLFLSGFIIIPALMITGILTASAYVFWTGVCYLTGGACVVAAISFFSRPTRTP